MIIGVKELYQMRKPCISRSRYHGRYLENLKKKWLEKLRLGKVDTKYPIKILNEIGTNH